MTTTAIFTNIIYNVSLNAGIVPPKARLFAVAVVVVIVLVLVTANEFTLYFDHVLGIVAGRGMICALVF